MRFLVVLTLFLPTVCISADDLDSEHQRIRREISSAQSFIDGADKFLMSKQSFLSQYQKRVLEQSARSARKLIELDCKLLTLDDPTTESEGAEHQFQFDACLLSELRLRQQRMKQFLCPESYFEGHPPGCEELKRLEARTSVLRD